jgi:SAM-dependent methyltransferase
VSTEYYDRLAPWYRLIYADWDQSVARQAAVLDDVIRGRLKIGGRRLLDAACGIGTQAIGLASLGYEVTALDLSSRALDEAKREATKRGLAITFGIGDMRWVGEGRRGQFDVVIACDNAVPHFANEAEIAAAFRQFRIALADGGGCLVSIRDYGAIERGRARVQPRAVHEQDGKRTALFDIWHFDGAEHYDFTTYVVEDVGTNGARVHAIRGGRCFCVEPAVLERLASEAGFAHVEILQDAYFQPLLVASTTAGGISRAYSIGEGE